MGNTKLSTIIKDIMTHKNLKSPVGETPLKCTVTIKDILFVPTKIAIFCFHPVPNIEIF